MDKLAKLITSPIETSDRKEVPTPSSFVEFVAKVAEVIVSGPSICHSIARISPKRAVFPFAVVSHSPKKTFGTLSSNTAYNSLGRYLPLLIDLHFIWRLQVNCYKVTGFLLEATSTGYFSNLNTSLPKSPTVLSEAF